MYYYIVNPAAGGGTINDIQDRLKATLRELQIDGEFAKTLGIGDAGTITTKALESGATTIVAVGGGETVNEVISALYRHKTDRAALGIVPVGKDNHLAQALGLGNWRQACEALARRRLVDYSLLTANKKIFIPSIALQASAPEPEAAAEPSKGWQKLLAATRAVTASDQPFEFQAALTKQLKLRGQAQRIEIHNHRFYNAVAEDELIIHLTHPSPADDKFLGKLSSWLPTKNQAATSYSQLAAKTLDLTCKQPFAVVSSSRPFTTGRLQVGLSRWKLRLVTNLVPPEKR